MAHFRNHQWQVNDEFLESVMPGAPYEYLIARERIFESMDNGDYEWPFHMAEKNWLDWPAFESAFRAAVHHFADAPGGPADPVVLERSIKAGRDRWQATYGERP